MAFFSKLGSLVRQTASRQISCELSAFRPSIYHAIRCMSSSKVFVGGLAYATDDQSLKEAFGKYGYVAEARVIVDRDTGRSRGFGFVTYSSSEEASSAIQALDGQELHGRRVRVNYATDKPRGGGFGGPGGGGYGGNYGGNYGNSFGSPGGNYGSGGNYGGNSGGFGSSSGNFGVAGGNDGGLGSFSGGNSGGFGSSGENFGVAGGNDGGFGSISGGNSGGFGSGSENFGVTGGSGATDGGFDGNAGVGFGGGDQFGNDEMGSLDGATEGPSDGNYRDEDDDNGDFAKRA